MPGLRDIVSNELLPFVSQPGQYVGGEVNQLPQPGDWQRANIRVVVAFPDSYTIGMSHLGCQILYWLANHTPGVTAERVFCPWTDAEQVMRAKKIPLFTWDTRQLASEADIFAVSLQYEMGFTNVLNLLDLAGIPLRADERDDSHPLIVAGGPQADNPEPVAEFLDLVVLGDGEESFAHILSAVQEYKASGVTRRDMIRLLAARFPWIYAPSLYTVEYNDDGTIRSFTPKYDDIPSNILRCKTLGLDAAPFPARPLIPHVKVIHDRFAVEIMRGCPQSCRFCHAGFTKRPISRRSIDKIVELAEQGYKSTGCDEIGLLSLSTSDYPQLEELARRMNEQFVDRRVSIAFPSLRVDKMLSCVPQMASTVRKSGLTMAVEAASDKLRSAIHKRVTDRDLLEGVRQAYQSGWKSVKLYFMVGFPGERLEDIDGILELSREVSRARIPINGAPAAVNASVGWLVPKPHTPFQWAAQPTAHYYHEARIRLRELSRATRSAVRLKMPNVERSVLEGVFSRGDRRLGRAIEAAWRLGARFDGWDDCFDFRRWNQAFEETGIDPSWYAHRERGRDEILPWQHLAGGVSREYLEKQYTDYFACLEIDRPAPGMFKADIFPE